MNTYTDYMAFAVKKHALAIPIINSLGIIICKQNNLPYTTIPNAPNNIKYIVEWRNQYISVIQMPGINEDIPIIDSLIVVVEFMGRNIGILSNEVDLVKMSVDKILEDRITGQKFFYHSGKAYFILNICQLYEELGILRIKL